MKYFTNFMFQELANKFSTNSKEYTVYVANYQLVLKQARCFHQLTSQQSVRTEQFSYIDI